MNFPAAEWRCALQLNRAREVVAGNRDALSAAIARGADVRLYTQFHWADHMGPALPDQGLVEESIDLRVMYLLEGDWPAGLTALRFPADAGLGFGGAASMSFFMYNWNGQFGIARPYFTAADKPTILPTDYGPNYHVIGMFVDSHTLSPSHNATYAFEQYGWLVRDDWREVMSHDADGNVVRGSLNALVNAFRAGASVKVAVRDLCNGLTSKAPMHHEIIVELWSMYYHRDKGFHSGESFPLVRIAPAKPPSYAASNWNFGWVLPRTDGFVHQLIIDPATRAVSRTVGRHSMRWMVR